MITVDFISHLNILRSISLADRRALDGPIKGYGAEIDEEARQETDRSIRPSGKKEHISFDVPTVSLHVHERINPAQSPN